MIGGLIGDCLGAPFEMKYENMVPLKKVTTFLEDVKNVEDSDKATDDCFEYTDDTAMARQIAKSFVEKKTIDTKSIAKNFTEEYFREPWRGYGGSVVEVFQKLKDSDCEDPFKPASEQFNGSGSYGNGAGMRAHPIALACYNDDPEEVVKVAGDVAKLTHFHHLGVTGGIMQTMAVYHALHAESSHDILQKIKVLVNDLEKNIEEDSASLYKHKIELVEKYVSCPEDDLAEVVFELGNDVSAVDSVPTAFFCYQRVIQNPEISLENKFEEVLRLAIRMGGDTDTIASMACSIAGADLGLDNIPAHLYTSCEVHQEMMEMAEEMFDILNNKTDIKDVGPDSKKQRTE